MQPLNNYIADECLINEDGLLGVNGPFGTALVNLDPHSAEPTASERIVRPVAERLAKTPNQLVSLTELMALVPAGTQEPAIRAAVVLHLRNWFNDACKKAGILLPKYHSLVLSHPDENGGYMLATAPHQARSANITPAFTRSSQSKPTLAERDTDLLRTPTKTSKPSPTVERKEKTAEPRAAKKPAAELAPEKKKAPQRSTKPRTPKANTYTAALPAAQPVAAPQPAPMPQLKKITKPSTKSIGERARWRTVEGAEAKALALLSSSGPDSSNIKVAQAVTRFIQQKLGKNTTVSVNKNQIAGFAFKNKIVRKPKIK